MHKIVIVLAVTFAVLGAASPAAMAGPDAGPVPPDRPRPESPAIPLTQTFVAQPGLAGTALVSCDAAHQFTFRGVGYPYRAADPTISGGTAVVTGGPFPYRASVESTAQVGGYQDAYYWRINNTGDAPATLVMGITCQRPDGF